MKKKTRKIEEISITRSFSMKVSLRGLTPSSDYEMADIFTSQTIKAKPKDAHKVSEAVYAWCKGETLKGVNAIRAEIIKAKTEKTAKVERKEKETNTALNEAAEE